MRAHACSQRMRPPEDMHRGDLSRHATLTVWYGASQAVQRLDGGRARPRARRIHLKEFRTPEIIRAHVSRAAKAGPLHGLLTAPVPIPASGPLAPGPLSALTHPAR